MKNVLLVSFLLLSAWGVSFAQSGKRSILLEPMDSTAHDKPRSAIETPTATLEGTMLTISFVSATPSEVIIIDQSSGQSVYSNSFASSDQLSIDLSEVCVPEVNYQIRLKAFWLWWRGFFDVEENRPAPTADGTIVEQDSVFYQLQGRNAVIVPAKVKYPNRMFLNNPINYPDTLIIPSQIIYEGVSYDVTGVEREGLNFCTSTSIILPNTIEYIGDRGFASCTNLKHFRLPESLAGTGTIGRNNETMGEWVFGGCNSLLSVEFPEGILSIPQGFFDDCRNLTSVTLPNSLTRIGVYAFQKCFSLSSIVIPEGVSIIDKGAFYMCVALESIVIPESVSVLGEGAFMYCHNLKAITLPNGLKEIGSACFPNCFALESIVIPEGVEVISVSLFSRCTSLSSVVLPKSLTEIESNAFYNIADSAHIYCQSIEPPTVGKNAFNQYGSNTLHVPQGCKEKYEESPYWKDFTTVIDDIVAGFSSDSDETDIIGVLSDEAVSSERFFDLQGRPADGTKKGIYIRNGKKVLVR